MTSPAMASLQRALQIEDGMTGALGADDDIRLACWMLDATRPWPEPIAGTMQALTAAHRDRIDDAAAWRTLRHAAIALGRSNDPELKRFGQVAEAAAWPLASSHAGLTELMRAICALRASQVSKDIGWTDAQEAEAIATLTRIADGDGVTKPRREDIPDLFKAERPALERDFFIHLQVRNMAFTGFPKEVAAWIAGAAR